MAKKNEATMLLQAHTVSFLNEQHPTLEEILRQIDSADMNIGDRTCTELSNGANAMLAGFIQHPQNAGLSFSVSFFEPEALHSTIRTDTNERHAILGAATAGDGHEFLSHRVSVFVKGNRVITCGLGKRERQICWTICKVASQAGIIAPTQYFGLHPLPHLETIDLINRYGVESIEFNATPLMRDFGPAMENRILDSIFNAEDTADSIRRKAQSTVKMQIKSKVLSRSSRLDVIEQVENSLAAEVSRGVLDSTDVEEFRIVLGNGQAVKNGRLSTTKKVKLAKNNTTHNHDAAHRAMVEFMNEIT